MMRFVSILVFFSVFSCQQSKRNPETHTLDFVAFSIEVPKDWKKVNVQGIDSYVGGIALDFGDTVYFDIGWWSNSLTESPPILLERSSFEGVNLDTTKIQLVDDLRSTDPDKYRKQGLSWDTIGGREVKIVFPRVPGQGTTGIYLDSFRTRNGEVDRFNLYGLNLKPKNQRQFLAAIKTIEFQDDK